MARLNPFQQLRAVSEAAEAEFEAICALLIRTQYPDAKRVRVHCGDGGVDTGHGTWGNSGALDVFQVKYFPDSLGSSQRQQIKESYNTAQGNQNFRLRRWTLCLPALLNQNDHQWFDTWTAEQDTHIEFWDGDKLEGLLNLPAAAVARGRLKSLGVLGIPSAVPDLRPILHAKRCDPTQGTQFFLQVELTNYGDAAADNLRLKISHTRETQHRAHSPFQPWKQENQELNPWIISLPRAMNPGEHLPVLNIPFGVQTPPNGKVEINISSRTTQARTWYAQAQESDITRNARIEFVADTPPWPKDEPKPVSNEPQFAPAKQLLDEILDNPDPETKGLSVILVRIPGQFGVKNYYPTISTGTTNESPLRFMESVDFDQALRELISLGWLRSAGNDRVRAVYLLAR